AGDAVLRAFADVLRAGVRESDLVARLGGEEVVVLIDGADIDAVRSVCERMRARLAETKIPVPGGLVSVTVSAGIAPLLPPASAEE
ncbi:GGDEF domain-containing protein, partial [Klebsiella pneumoniae]|nr:GGDEF domain-containing protein [Klebsiella pneumoniae]